MDNNEHEHGAVPSTLHTTSPSHPGEPNDLTPGPGTPKSDRQSAGTSADKDEVIIPHPPILSTRSLVHLALNNFFAMSLISLKIFIIFFTVTLFTVFQDARSMNDRVLSNATGVSLCSRANERTLLTTVDAAGIDTWPQHSTGPRCMRIIYLVENRRLRCSHYFWKPVMG